MTAIYKCKTYFLPKSLAYLKKEERKNKNDEEGEGQVNHFVALKESCEFVTAAVICNWEQI